MPSNDIEGFSAYFAERYIALGDYFTVHRARFIESWKCIVEEGFARPCRVLDIGGVGPLSGYLRDAYGASALETKTDLRRPLDLPDASADLIICTETIEHVKDQESDRIEDLESFNFSGMKNLLRELHRICAPDGAVLLTTPNANSYITLHKWLNGEALLMDPNHVRELSVGDLRSLVEGAGFRFNSLKAIDNWSAHFGKPIDMLMQALGHLRGAGDVPRGDNIFAVLRKTPSAALHQTN